MDLAYTHFSDFTDSYETLASTSTQICLLNLVGSLNKIVKISALQLKVIFKLSYLSYLGVTIQGGKYWHVTDDEYMYTVVHFGTMQNKFEVRTPLSCVRLLFAYNYIYLHLETAVLLTC